jgi:hypothetical protein
MGNKLDYKDFSHRKDAKNAKNNIYHGRNPAVGGTTM